MNTRTALLLTALTPVGACLPASADSLAVNFRGTLALPASTTDQHGQPFDLAGLSGLSWINESTFVAVMDNSDKLVLLDVTLDPDGTLCDVTLVGGLTLAESRDFEGVACTGLACDSVLLAEEGTPAIHEYSLADGTWQQTLDIPAVFLNRRANFGLESLSLRADGASLWTANEEALTVDGGLSTPQQGTTVRLLHYGANGANFTPAEQYAYSVEPMHGGNITGGRSGLVDLVALSSGRVLALERSLAFSIPGFFQSRLYEIEFAGATDVSGLTGGLIGETYTPLGKRLLWSGSVGNMEGLAIGPALADGGRALLGIVDDGDPLSSNQIVAFELTGPFGHPGAVPTTDPISAKQAASASQRPPP